MLCMNGVVVVVALIRRWLIAKARSGPCRGVDCMILYLGTSWATILVRLSVLYIGIRFGLVFSSEINVLCVLSGYGMGTGVVLCLSSLIAFRVRGRFVRVVVVVVCRGSMGL